MTRSDASAIMLCRDSTDRIFNGILHQLMSVFLYRNCDKYTTETT